MQSKTKYLCVFIHIRTKSEVGAVKPVSVFQLYIFNDSSKAVLPAGKGMTSWLLLVMFNCVFVTFPCGILGQVWSLIVSIPNLCCLSYCDFICHHCKCFA